MRDDARLIATMRDLSLPCVPMHVPLLKMVVSLHSKTVGKWPISDSFSQSAFALPSLWVRSAFASGGEEKRETGGRQKQGKNRPPLTNPTKDRAVGGKNKSVWLF